MIQTERRLLKERLINNILEKKKKITEDKMTLNITGTTSLLLSPLLSFFLFFFFCFSFCWFVLLLCFLVVQPMMTGDGMFPPFPLVLFLLFPLFFSLSPHGIPEYDYSTLPHHDMLKAIAIFFSPFSLLFFFSLYVCFIL